MLEGFVGEGIPVAVFWVFVGLAIVIQGISKSGFAGGAGILSLPLMMLVMPVDKVSATLLPLLILCDMNAIYHHRRNVVWKVVLQIYLPSILGILVGAWVWWKIGQAGVSAYEPHIKRFVGVIAVLFACYLVAKETAMAWVDRYKPGTRTGLVAGAAAGFTSTIAHAAGPIVSLFIFSQGLGKTLFVGTVAWTFTLINLTKLPFYLGVGLIDPGVLKFDLCLVWLIPIGSYLGKWMHYRVSESLFNRVILVLTFVAGLQLISGVNLVRAVLEWFV
ncbi:MAG: sulfite exporter TauE/SafE family protein [bacterium]|nr:sulfite exporter TauE/SafE family protein [bacterium]